MRPARRAAGWAGAALPAFNLQPVQQTGWLNCCITALTQQLTVSARTSRMCVFDSASLAVIGVSLGRQSFWNPQRLQRGQPRLPFPFSRDCFFFLLVFLCFAQHVSFWLLPSGSALLLLGPTAHRGSECSFSHTFLPSTHLDSARTLSALASFSRAACKYRYKCAKRVGTQVSGVSQERGSFVSKVSESLCEFAAYSQLVE